MGSKYKAFISYRHVPRDSAAAKAIHTAVERYVIPKKLRKGGKKHPGRVFRDEEELSISEDLSEDICEALDQSEFLIVVCSPDTLDSKWVPREIAYFREHRDPENILTVLTGGDSGEIFRTLMPGMPEPLFLDLSGSPTRVIARELKEQFLKLCAPLLGCRYDDLVRRDEKRRRRQMFGWMGGIAAIAALIIGILMWSNWQIDGKNAELEQKNEQLEQQNTDLLLRESEILTQEAMEALADGDTSSAVRNALSALPSAESDRPYYAPAEQALWSVLDPLRKDEETLVPHDTIVEQNTDIRDHVISTDGRLLITSDRYSLLTGFDTVTGEPVWSRKLFPDDSFISMPLYPCRIHNSLLVPCSDTIFSISQDTGEVLWTLPFYSVSTIMELSDDGRYAACIVRESRSSDLTSLICFSTEDGTILNTFPLADADSWMDLTDGNAFDFSSDAALLAGSIIERDGFGPYTQVCFVADLSTGRAETILRRDTTQSDHDTYALSFTDNDQTLTIVRESEDLLSTVLVEKYRVADKALLWQTRTPEPESVDSWNFSLFGAHCSLIERGDHILLGMDNCLYAFEHGTGELISWRILDSGLLWLEPTETGPFILVLADGTYSFGLLTQDGFYLLKEFPLFPSDPTMELGAIQEAFLWKNGYLEFYFDQSSVGVVVHTEDEGYGYCAVRPRDNDRRVILKRVTPFTVDLDRQTIFSLEKDGSVFFSSLAIGGPDTITLSYTTHPDGESRTYHQTFFDRTTIQQTDTLPVPEQQVYLDHAYAFSDTSGCVYENLEYDICIYDAATKLSRPLYRTYRTGSMPSLDLLQLSVDGRSCYAAFRSIAHGRLREDQKLLTAVITTRGLKLWLEGEPLADTLYPDDLNWPKGLYLSSGNLTIGGNGYLLMDLLESGCEPENDSYFLYSIHDGQWYRFPFGENDQADHITSLGECSPVFTVMDSSGMIRSHDILTGEEISAFHSGLNSNAVSKLRWILEDRFLAVKTNDNSLLIFDGTTGEAVYREHLSGDPSFAADLTGKRLYIWDTTGLCVDLESWTTLVTIPDIELYDPVSDRIFYSDTLFSDVPAVYSYRLPTTEELVELGKQYLGE